MTARINPARARWAWDARGPNRAVRVSTHAEAGLLNLSMWRDDICVGTARLAPEEAAGLIAGMSGGLAELARQPDQAATGPERMHELELRLARLEHEVQAPLRRRLASAVTGWALKRAVRAGRPAAAAPAPAPLTTV